jgi:hypothetical protein
LRRASILLVPCLIAAALLVGCGDDDPDSTETALSKSEYLEQGNEICKQQDAEIAAVAERTFGSSAPSQAELIRFANDRAIPQVEETISKLRALTPPAGDERTVKAIYEAAEEGVAKLKETPTLVVNGGEVFAKANKLAAEYGLNECAD